MVSAVVGVLVLIPHLGRELYLVYAGLYALVGFFSVFPQSGVTLTVLEHTVRNDESPRMVARSCMSLAVLTGLALTPLCIGVAAIFSPTVPLVTVVLFTVSELIVQSVWSVLVALAQSTRSYQTGIVLRVISIAMRLAVMFVLVAFDVLTLNSLAITNLVLVAGSIVVVGAIATRGGWVSMRPGRISRTHARSMITYALGIGASTVHNTGDNYVLLATHPKGDAGVYPAGQRAVSLAMVPLSALAASTHFAVLRAGREMTNQLHKAWRFTLVGACYAVPAAIVLAIAAPVVPLVLGHEFDGTTNVIRLLAPVVVLRGLSVFPMNGLLGLGLSSLRTKLLLFNAFFSVSLYLTLIPKYSWHGAAAATLISEVVSFIIAWVALSITQRRVDRLDSPALTDDDAEIAELVSVVSELSQEHIA